ncbi:MAG TPA: glycosyltransferase family 2 protein [Flexilinea sp.]|nr:glycosyltransferase family 2 protein [Flexilinea sp.]
MAKLVAVLPAYNEEKHISQVVRELKHYIDDIVVVDDGSVDRTKALAEAEGVTVLSRGYNCGVGQTTKDGLAWALEHGFDAVILLDSDGQHAPSEIGRFIEKYERDHNKMIIGYRDYKQMPLFRRFTNTIGKFLLSHAVGQDLPDNQSGYRLVDKELIPLLLESKEAGYNFLVEMIIVCLSQGWEIGWVPISTIYGDERSHQNAWYQIKGFTRMCIEAHRKIKASEKERKND